jgi:hypothetical protein
MFGWFRPTCPCDPVAKRWVEERLRWLSKQFGLHILLEQPIVLPTPEFFPDVYDGTPNTAKCLFRRVCGYMGVDSDAVDIEFFHNPTPRSLQTLDPSLGFAAGTWSRGEGPWQRGIVRIEKGGLDRPADLIGIMAHELAHQRLLGEGRCDAGEYDNELLTDLTAVYHGFGVFLANNPRKSTGELRNWPGTKLCRPEYLSEPMAGYAMAHIAWFRDEAKPLWAKHLRWAQRGVFKQGLHYLAKTANSTFTPVRLHRAAEDEE